MDVHHILCQLKVQELYIFYSLFFQKENLSLNQESISIGITTFRNRFSHYFIPLISKIKDSEFWKTISANQTLVLISKFKEDFPEDFKTINLLEEVNLMTPENIHLNSFMYEPILDMSNDSLKDLYKRVSYDLGE